jgi:protein-S-isoprenylcysteine O-methyltransferase Ste14
LHECNQTLKATKVDRIPLSQIIAKTVFWLWDGMPVSQIVAETVFWLCLLAFFLMRLPWQRQAQAEPIRISQADLRDWFVLRSAETGLAYLPLIYEVTKFPSFATYPFFSPFAVIGTAIFLAALYVFFLAHHDLGRGFSSSLEIRRDHQLVTVGIYRYIRHPMYLGFLLWAIAQALLLPNWIVAAAGFMGWLTLLLVRIPREERLMVQEFGDQYRAYMACTKRLIPGVF